MQELTAKDNWQLEMFFQDNNKEYPFIKKFENKKVFGEIAVIIKTWEKRF